MSRQRRAISTWDLRAIKPSRHLGRLLALLRPSAIFLCPSESWSRLSEQFFRFDKWSLCRR